MNSFAMAIHNKPDKVHRYGMNHVFLVLPIHNDFYLAILTWNYFFSIHKEMCMAKNLIWMWVKIQIKICIRIIYKNHIYYLEVLWFSEFHEKDLICRLPPVKGPCEALYPRWYYSKADHTCLLFIYGGCDGNANNFETEKECLEKCQK